MTDTDLITAGESPGADKQPESVTKDTSDVNTMAPGGSLSTMVLPELRALANRAGVKGTSGMRKNELIAAIQEITGQANGASAGSTSSQDSDRSESTVTANVVAAEEAPEEGRSDSGETQRRERRKSSREAGTSVAESGDEAAAGEDAATTDEDAKGRQGQASAKVDERGDKTDEREESGGEQQGLGGQQARGEEDGEGRQGRRGRRFRDRRRRGERSGEGAEAEVREDDVLQPVAGILDVLDNYAFVRTSGYLAGPHDVYVSMNMVRKNGLRRGDAVTGAVRVPREGEAGDKNPRQKFNPLVRLDSVNGGSVEDAKKRPDFSKLTPLYPNQRLRLETTTERLTTRVIDLIMPIGKGQRALIVSPPKAGKTTILQDIANAITRNNPECHLMVVLVDERPEEVTDMQRSVKGEVIASTFDRPPSDHTSVAELAIERAKRLVEQGKDVVVLLDSITRLGRAYNNASPASGRILSGGVDSTALYPPKRFLGAARNIEEGGSLTIIATAMVETGSTGDTVIFEEFKGTGNAELKLDRKISERRVFPAVDVNPSGTRKDELLLSPDEFAIVHKLRRVLSGLDAHQAIDLLMSQLRKTKNNYEFLVQVSKTTPGNMDND
ncbi:transcription termination factor Rho [Mycobacterium ostraviense]|uniref:Transcription termination factor Rho n=1 Tax=Mycobacterium ostraviense TaxID=2738409 RepID=A0A164AW44_9MYCO|nr:transcription termination factor Rho [Mycobacterium ostraviense]KZS62872.1 transcription termination factor Rho [Mycobacterium ostraviense]UGT92700.1 transcription termination factor Rho [Mycobacterium ostraviense]